MSMWLQVSPAGSSLAGAVTPHSLRHCSLVRSKSGEQETETKGTRSEPGPVLRMSMCSQATTVPSLGAFVAFGAGAEEDRFQYGGPGPAIATPPRAPPR